MEQPIVKSKKGISPIWLLPLVALLIGSWLIYKDIRDSGIMIDVRIKDASGLTAGKTQVMFKGLPVGTLRSFRVTSDLQYIDAEIEMVKETRDRLTPDTKFWVVRPEVSMNRIAGLDTLVSGSYFEVRPGSEPGTSEFFTALDVPPPISSDAPGLHLILQSRGDVCLDAGSPVLFKRVEVGEVVENILQQDGSIETKILVYPKYEKHVTNRSRFYRSSGIHLTANLPNVDLKIDPVKAILLGGVSFYTPSGGQPIKDTATPLPLYEDLEKAKRADDIPIRLTLSVDHNIAVGADIRFQGIKIGQVTSLNLQDDQKTIRAKASIGKKLETLLHADTYIWPVTPRFGLAEVSNLDTVIMGSYLNLVPGTGPPARSFQVHDTRPPNIPLSRGLNIVLETDRLGSLGYNKPVYYRQVQVGHTTGYELSPTGQTVLIYVNIDTPFTNLIRENTRFWNSSGLRIQGGL